MRLGFALALLAAHLSGAPGGLVAPKDPVWAEYFQAWSLVGEHPEEGIASLKGIISRHQDFHRVYETLALAYWDNRQTAAGKEYFSALAAGDPANGLADYALGILIDRDESEPPGSSSEHYARCLQKQPSAWVCYQGTVQSLADLRKQRVSEQDLHQIITWDESRPETALLLGSLYISQRRIDAALRVMEAALERIQGTDRPEFEAALHAAIAGAHVAAAAKATEAILEHDRAALEIYQRLGDPEGQMIAGVQVAQDYATRADPAGAREVEDRYLSVAREVHSRIWEVIVLRAVGHDSALGGDLDRAIEAFTRQAALLEAAGYPGRARDALYDLGRVYRRQGRFAEAIECFNRALALSVNAGDRFLEAHNLRNLGGAYGDLGDYFRRLQLEAESARIFRQEGYRWQAGAGLGNVAETYAALGDYTSARDNYLESLRQAREHQDFSEQEWILISLARLSLTVDRPLEALGYLDETRQYAGRVWYPEAEVEALAVRGSIYKRLGRYRDAIESTRAAVVLAQAGQDRTQEAGLLSELGDCHLHAGDLAGAATAFERALALAETTGRPAVVASARRGLGETARRRGDYPAALANFRAAIDSIEKMRTQIPSPELRAGFLQENWKVYEEIVEVLSRLDQRQPGAGYGLQAFEYSERGRARSFLDLLVESRARITRGLTAEQIRQQGLLLGAISAASRAMDERPSAVNRIAIENAEDNLVRWAAGIRQTNPAYHQLRYPDPSTALQAQEVAARDGTIVEYALGATRSHAWLISGHRIRMVRLAARAEIEREVRALRQEIERRPRGRADAEFQIRARRLYAMLVEPLAPWLTPGQRITIVPDGILHYLPFETLIAGKDGQSRFLIEDYTIGYAPSVTVYASLMAQRRPKADVGRRELLAYGDPVLPAPGRGAGKAAEIGEIVRGVYSARGAKFTALPAARAEVESIGALFPPGLRRTRVGAEASEAALKREDLTVYKRLHFATHAVVDEQIPARSGLLLAPGGPQEDGVLQLNEIFNLDLDAELVTLSACHTGLGKLVKGEGVVGLTRAFLYAGAARVAVSLWEVNDLATARLMESFYQRMKAGDQPAEALRQAKLAMLRAEPTAWRHPYFWAPFVLVGAY
ncbi:MAG: CHAT domain-containing tetratricopeptide repeat protein [Bryobacteraceae bacterium]